MLRRCRSGPQLRSSHHHKASVGPELGQVMSRRFRPEHVACLQHSPMWHSLPVLSYGAAYVDGGVALASARGACGRRNPREDSEFGGGIMGNNGCQFGKSELPKL